MRTVMLIGGSGTLGNAILPLILADPEVRRVRVFSRSEHPQIEMEKRFQGERVDYLLGDIANRERIRIACKGVDEVYNLAAIKSVDKAEYNVDQTYQTNIMGTLNVINACIENGVKKAIFTSSDKAAAPLNLYGASKLFAELAWIDGNTGSHNTRFSALRYGNVFASQGSVIPKWFEHRASGKPLLLTNPEATRFFITKKDAAQFVYSGMQMMTGGETFLPKMKSCRIYDLACLISDNFDTCGLRPGDKLDEILITEDEAYLVNDLGDRFCRYPYAENYPVVKKGTSYQGGAFTSMNAERFTQEELRAMLEGL